MNACASCHEKLDMWSGRHQSAKGILCHTCYYTEFGEEVEQHPIGAPLHAISKWRELP